MLTLIDHLRMTEKPMRFEYIHQRGTSPISKQLLWHLSIGYTGAKIRSIKEFGTVGFPLFFNIVIAFQKKMVLEQCKWKWSVSVSRHLN